MTNDNKLTHHTDINYKSRIPDAIIFAFNAHSGQYRKIHPYQFIIHPLRVSEFILRNFSHRPELETLRVAAILHDTVEDTWASIEDIETQFGKEVADIVFELTKPEIDDKRIQKEEYLNLLKQGHDESKIIKLADIFDNAILSTDDSQKWKEFIKERKIVLEELELKEKDETYTKIKDEVLKLMDERLKQYE